MRVLLKIVFGFCIVMVIAWAAITLYQRDASDPLVESIEAICGLILSLSSVVLYIYRTAKRDRKHREAWDEAVESLPFDKLKYHAAEDLCSELGIDPSDADRHLFDDLNVPKGIVITALDNLGLDYHLDISGSDVDHFETLNDILKYLVSLRPDPDIRS